MTKEEEPYKLSCSEKDKYDLYRQIAKRDELITAQKLYIEYLVYAIKLEGMLRRSTLGVRNERERWIEQLKSQII